MQVRSKIKKCGQVSLILFTLLGFSVGVKGQQTEEEAPVRIRTVVIDPGHGGKDKGAVGGVHFEKDIVLDISLKVRDYLKQYLPEINVVMTRETDEFVPLNERARIANENDADLFVSIHANSMNESHTYGTETFVLGLHRSKENLEVAKKENSVIVLEEDYKTKYEGFDPNSTESYIIFELMQNVYLDQSINFASVVQEQFKNRVGRHNRGVKQAGFLVLRETSMPGVLVEVGFLSNRQEEQFIASENGRVYLASAIFRAIRNYKERYDNRNSTLVQRSRESQIAENLEKQNQEPASEEDGIEYRIQVASSAQALDENEGPYKHFDNVWEYKENGSYKYTTGKAPTHEEIMKILPEVREVVPDCFVVGFKDGERVIP
ncbi:MAG: N-acetylmuramoyl-L-alanine amidase family protein [Marinilabiliaceae bacterium]